MTSGVRYEALFFFLVCHATECGHNFLVDMYLIPPPPCLGEFKFNTCCFFVHGGS